MGTQYTAIRLNREPGRDIYNRYFSVVWETATEVVDPTALFEKVTAQNGEVWALWSVSIRPGWRTFVDRNEPHFMMMKHPTGEPMMLTDEHASEIRELAFTREEK